MIPNHKEMYQFFCEIATNNKDIDVGYSKKFATEQEIRSHHPTDHDRTAGEAAAGESLPGTDRAFARPVTDFDASGGR